MIAGNPPLTASCYFYADRTEKYRSFLFSEKGAEKIACTTFEYQNHKKKRGQVGSCRSCLSSREKLFSEYDQKQKNYLCKKEVVYTEIMLPENAPPEYADRETTLELCGRSRKTMELTACKAICC
ncbi:hypothetical protein EVA_13122 [gut metagenome]|uniref:MobA/MobL protein domain-containing protein n=1 Tax=gut metagenome TaxID=749906 RepID=J9CFH8_9ZZZZ